VCVGRRTGPGARSRSELNYSIAIGSATESAAMFDVCLRRGLIANETHERGKQLLERIVAMLIKLCRALRADQRGLIGLFSCPYPYAYPYPNRLPIA
jgi:hypothetical protein